jgi:hypothetical protein
MIHGVWIIWEIKMRRIRNNAICICIYYIRSASRMDGITPKMTCTNNTMSYLNLNFIFNMLYLSTSMFAYVRLLICYNYMLYVISQILDEKQKKFIQFVEHTHV